MDLQSLKYFQGRERTEREAAERSSCPQARRAHEGLAREYAVLIERQRLPLT